MGQPRRGHLGSARGALWARAKGQDAHQRGWGKWLFSRRGLKPPGRRICLPYAEGCPNYWLSWTTAKKGRGTIPSPLADKHKGRYGRINHPVLPFHAFHLHWWNILYNGLNQSPSSSSRTRLMQIYSFQGGPVQWIAFPFKNYSKLHASFSFFCILTFTKEIRHICNRETCCTNHSLL